MCSVCRRWWPILEKHVDGRFSQTSSCSFYLYSYMLDEFLVSIISPDYILDLSSARLESTIGFVFVTASATNETWSPSTCTQPSSWTWDHVCTHPPQPPLLMYSFCSCICTQHFLLFESGDLTQTTTQCTMFFAGETTHHQPTSITWRKFSPLMKLGSLGHWRT